MSNESVIVFASPVSVGHVRPLMPLAKRLAARGFGVVWAISGDANEPASAWRAQIEALGATFVDLDTTVRFERGTLDEFASSSIASVYRRVLGRANDVGAGAADALRAAIGTRHVIAGIYDFFALWAYVAMRRLAIPNVNVLISAFPTMLEDPTLGACMGDAVYVRELASLRATGAGAFAEPPRGSIIPHDPELRVLSFSSPRLCPTAPPYVTVLGVQPESLPQAGDIARAPAEHQALAAKLAAARAEGTRVVLLSMGTVVTKMFQRFGKLAFLKRLYSTIAASALAQGAIVIASTCDATAAELGVDEATLGAAARDRVIAMPFVPQPFLFAHGLVDVMLMHGGANTFHEAVVSGIPLLISPGFGDQEYVAIAADRLGVGVCVEAAVIANLPNAATLDAVANDLLPAMLAPGVSRWKARAVALADQIKTENGLDAAEALITG